MVLNCACLTLQRLVIPCVLMLAALFRPVGISFVYLLMFFISPFIPVATQQNFRGSVSAYLLILIALSTILLLCHVGLQIAIVSLNIGSVFEQCAFTQQLLRHIGFISFFKLGPLPIVEWLIPEVAIFITSIVVYLLIKRITFEGHLPEGTESLSIEDAAATTTEVENQPNKPSMERKFNIEPILKMSPFFCLSTIFFSAILRPSVPGGIYFLFFLLSGTYWATFKTLQRGFAILVRLLMVVFVLHSLSIVAYQTPWVQQHVDCEILAARLVSLEPLIRSTCENDIRILEFETKYKLDSYLNPILMLFSYYILALASNHLLLKQLMRRNKPIPLPDHIDSSVDIEIVEHEAMNSEQKPEPDKDLSLIEQICYGFGSIGGFIYQNSYIFTNILMMAWSIVYHSWLTFVFLLWANVLWMIPNQRKAMMRSSPFIVFYAEVLLIAQYIYGMNLNNDELPSHVNVTGINLKQIGLVRPSENNVQPCLPLIVKTLFLLMFWVTLRQFFKEKTEKKRTGGAMHMTPTHSSEIEPSRDWEHKKKTSKFLKKAGDIIKNILVRLWIWLLILVIFLCAITGVKMTGFRIFYMALFLFFLLVFQTSSKAWVKIMYGFWLFLIFYAMSMLTLIYTYQFDKFDQYWNDYLNISRTLQEDIGLKKYETKDLFLHLVSPTIIVILTVIQVHYFHKRFVAALQQLPTQSFRRPNKTPSPVLRSMAPSANMNYDVTVNINESIKDVLRRVYKNFKSHLKYVGKHFKGVCWRFLEIHLIKAVYLAAFVCCVNEICVLHIAFCLLCIIGVMCNMKARVAISRIISLVVTVIILAKMIYQVQYISHENFSVYCNNTNIKQNNIVWFGLQKTTVNGGLMDLIKKYIIYMVVVTLHAVVLLRQNQMRLFKGITDDNPPKLLFPDVTRSHADQDLEGMIKYMFNYGYYKFGVELTLITLAALITYRQDLIAILYVIWLCVLISIRRTMRARLWPAFQFFTATIIFVQFLISLGLPPGLCIEYPWEQLTNSKALQKWAMLPGSVTNMNIHKIIFDYVLLMFICRQTTVFKMEKMDETARRYPGGSNKSVVRHIESLSPIQIPTRDFLATVRNYLDIFKNVVLCGFFWLTLSMVFLAGLNTTDLLSIGYLVGSFVFLWQGTDFYLLPLQTILKRWYFLIAYNVSVITVKTFLQIGGCLFLKSLEMNVCWLIHIVGITCADAVNQELPETEDSRECPTLRPQSILVWDTFCFALLILQLRIFKSYYFCHIVNNTRANALLAHRGFEIIEELRRNQIEHRKQHEEEVLRKIKRKMELIRATQQKMIRPTEKLTHYDEHGFPLPGPKVQKRKDLKYHTQAIRAGDYYMFEEMDEKFELEVIEDEVDFLEEQGKLDETENKMARRKTLFDTDKGERHDKQKHDKPTSSHVSKESKEEHPEAKPKDSTTAETDDDGSPNPIIRLLEAFVVSVVIRLNRLSRNYRYVMKTLAEEKKLLKDSRHYSGALSTPSKSRIDDEDSFSNAQSNQSDTEIHETNTTTTTAVLHQPCIDIDDIGVDTTDTPLRFSSQELPVKPGGGEFIYEEEFTAKEHNIVVEALIAGWYVMLSNTDLICYIIVFINQVVNASIISLPLPLMVFFWGTLSLPRPTKRFWVTLIAYTQALILIKCLSQFRPFWSNYVTLPNQPLAAPKIIGIELNEDYATYDLVLLLVLFFHRFVLKTQGLWKSDYNPQIKISHRSHSIDDDRSITSRDSSRKDVSQSKVSQATRKADEKILETTSMGSYKSEEIQLPNMNYVTDKVTRTDISKFFFDLVHKSRLPSDVYALMFFCDFINFFVLLFGFTAFGQQGDGGVQTYLSENKVPIPFLIMLLLQFVLIVVDRALYLRKALVHKIFFHFLSVIGIHIWMFFVVPAVTERSFNSLTPPKMFYIIKCFYLLFSAYQIKCGFPQRILGNVLTKGFSLVNMTLFRVYMQIPFLFELRTILDWVCTDSTMTLFDWLKMEDIFSEIFFIKCSRQFESDFPALRATKKPMLIKILMGGTIILLIVIAVWGPLSLFALGNAVGQPNLPYEVSAEIRIGPYAPIYITTSRESIYSFDDKMYDTLKNVYMKKKPAIQFLSNYDDADVAAVILKSDAPSLWAISPAGKQQLLDDLMKNETLTCRFTLSLTRIPPVKGGIGTVTSEITAALDRSFPGRDDMISMLQGNSKTDFVVIPDMLPKFLKVLNAGDVTVIRQLMLENTDYRPLKLNLHTDASDSQMWWRIQESCEDAFYKNTLSQLPFADCNAGVVLYTFNDKKFPSTFSFLTAGGIIGLYTTFVLLASRFMKSFIAGQSRKVMYEDLPYVDRVLQLCLDIYLVREALELALEEDLFAKLLFLYRSPETMVKWTRPREETHDDETDTESVRSRISRRAE